MNQIEYINEKIKLTADELTIINMGVASPDTIDSINDKIQEVISRRGKEGWEALYPFSVPLLWFKRTKQKKSTDTKTKK